MEQSLVHLLLASSRGGYGWLKFLLFGVEPVFPVLKIFLCGLAWQWLCNKSKGCYVGKVGESGRVL